jgi:chromate transporter
VNEARGRQRPSLQAIFACFFWIGAQSFGGGLSAWIRREVVDRRGWMRDRSLLAGIALAQICPGANATNLAIHVGAALRGSAGAIVALTGVLAVPVALTLAAGRLYLAFGALPAIDAALRGLAAAAIGLMLANGVQLSARAIRDARSAAVMAATAAMIGPLHMALPLVLALALPASAMLLGREPER